MKYQSLFIGLVASVALAGAEAGPVTKIKLHGDRDDAVVTAGSYKLDAGQSTSGGVVLIGSTGMVDGTVNGDLVIIGSKVAFSGTVNGDFVTIGSNLLIGSGAVANGDFVSCASDVKGEEELRVNGEHVTLNTFSPAVPVVKEVLTNFVQFRPISPFSGFSWTLGIIVLIVSLVFGLIFPKAIAGTDVVLRERPVPSFLIGLAVILGAAVLSFLLLITIVGIIALPFLALAIFILNLFGSTSVSYWIGKRIAPHIAERSYAMYAWITIGTAVIWILDCIPVIGFIAAGVVSLLGLGTVAIYLVERYRLVAPQTGGAGATPLAPPGSSPPAPSTPLALPSVEPALAMSFPRAQFLPRLVANLIDLVVLYALLSSLHLTRAVIPLWVLYRFAMFAWRSATLGQMVLNLRVQKPDGSSLVGDYSTALIRALSSLLSLLPLGLGFIWILFNRELAAWHDKISFTYVVQLNPSVTRSTTPPHSPGPSTPNV
ncbi:MAG: RDD family protein [Verrucomicrobia bacterium]|nr:RDD family protein [Verrucomicrobiota bacterium]